MIQKSPALVQYCKITLQTHGRVFALALAALLAAFSPAVGKSLHGAIITWGPNTPQWNKKLRVSGIRIGCSETPDRCILAVDQTASSQHVSTILLSVLFKPERSLSDAIAYSRLSLAHPALYEVGFDDFVGQMEKLQMDPSRLAPLLSQFIAQLKSQNPNLHFGITVYENELSSPVIRNPAFSSAYHAVDVVHLFLHYRSDGPQFSAYVQQAKARFPNATIVAGAYAYDRRDYLPCSASSHSPCHNDEELSLFKQTFTLQFQLLREGAVGGIEFWPGNFGSEAHWSVWKSPRNCQPDRIQQCEANTASMRQFVAEQLADAGNF